MRYRKRPVEIDAVPVSEILYAADNDWASLPGWVRDAYETGKILVLLDAVEIDTLEGRMRGAASDVLIRGVRGELYPCRGDIFTETYQPA